MGANIKRELQREAERRYRQTSKGQLMERKKHWRKYGMDVDKAFEVSTGPQVCSICGEYGNSVDHCHRTKQVRGILCKLCNLGLGNFRDNRGLLSKASEYLEKHQRRGG